MLNTFVVYVENKPGVLNRVASLFRRRDFNIESLTVGHTESPGISRMTIVTDTDQAGAFRVETNLYKLLNVISVENITAAPTVSRELAMIKVAASTAENRTQLMQLAAVFRARVVDVAPTALVIEITGTEDKIDGLLEVLRHYGILEMVRTGRVAMSRGVTDASGRAATDAAAHASRNDNGDGTVVTPSLDTDDGMIAFSV
jgi:acetolactate synthase-1/3 small subunit